MKYLLIVLCCAFFFRPLASASEADTNRAATALVQAVAKRKPPASVKSSCSCGANCACCQTVKQPGCSCGLACTCINGECGDPACPSLAKKSPGPGEWILYQIRYAQALKAGKPLIIWVGEACPPCEAKWTEYVHAHLSEYNGAKGKETGPEVIIARPDGLGGMDIVGRIDGIPTQLAIQNLLQGQRSNPRDEPTWGNVNPYNRNPHWPYQSRPQTMLPTLPVMPMMRPMMPMMMGGFGGGFGGGGCVGCGRGG